MFTDNEVKYFALTAIDKSSMYIQTSLYKTERSLIEAISNKVTSIRQINVETERNPIAFATGFFISAQEVNKEFISTRYNKLWEILKWKGSYIY